MKVKQFDLLQTQNLNTLQALDSNRFTYFREKSVWLWLREEAAKQNNNVKSENEEPSPYVFTNVPVGLTF